MASKAEASKSKPQPKGPTAPPAFCANRLIEVNGEEFGAGDEITVPFPDLATEERFLSRGDIGKLS